MTQPESEALALHFSGRTIDFPVRRRNGLWGTKPSRCVELAARWTVERCPAMLGVSQAMPRGMEAA